MQAYKRIDRKIVSELSEINSFKSIGILLLDWLLIFGTVYLTEKYFSWPLYILAVIFIGTRLHAFGVLLHEATHWRMLKNRKVNDWVGEIFCAWPLLVTLHGYRANHLAHHRDTNTESDPDWKRKLTDPYFQLPKTKKELFKDLLKGVSGGRFLFDARMVIGSKDLNNIPKSLNRARIAFYLAVIGSSIVLGVMPEVLMYWVVPIMTSFGLIMYIRSVAEHHGGGMDYDDVLGSSRHVDANWIERIFFPHNVNYHLDHHLYPSVPFFNLPRLHRKLMEQEDYRTRAHITDGYAKGLFKECVKAA